MTDSSRHIRLSVLDQSPIREGGSAADAIAESVELAQHAEAQGFYRYWLAEHHGTDGLAGPAPEHGPGSPPRHGRFVLVPAA